MSREDGSELLALSAKHEQAQFIGRENELTDLEQYIYNSEGGTILLGGLRGAGKTKFLQQLESRLQKQREQKIFLIDIVLHDDITAEELRYVLLRSISHSLGKVEHRLKWWKLNDISLFRVYLKLWFIRTFRKPAELKVRRSKEFARLKRFVGYTKATEKIGHELKSAIKRYGVGLDHKKSSAIDGEIDLSSSRLEQMLRDYLEAVSKLGVKIVFVFDELDKFEGKDLTAAIIASKFKNLLTRNGTFAVFITSEKDLSQIKKQIASNPYGIEHTLFSKVIQLNQLAPDEFSGVVEGLFTKAALDHDRFEEVRDYILWETSLHLFSLKQFIDKHKVIARGKPYFEVSRYDITHEGALQHLLTRVYWDGYRSKDDHFNRLLYLCLRYVLQQPLYGHEMYIDEQRSRLTTIAVRNDFKTEQGFVEFLDSNILSPLVYQKSFAPEDWRHGLSLLTSGELHQINAALHQLLWMMDQAGLLVQGEDDDISVQAGMELILSAIDNFTYLDAQTVDTEHVTTEERSLVNTVRTVHRMAARLGVDTQAFEELVRQQGGKLSVVAAARDIKQLQRSFSWQITATRSAVEAVEESLRATLLDRFYQEIFVKLGGEERIPRNSFQIQLQELRIKHKAINISTKRGGFYVYFVDSIPEKHRAAVLAKQKQADVIVEIADGETPVSKERHWYQVRLEDDLANYQRSIKRISSTLRRL